MVGKIANGVIISLAKTEYGNQRRRRSNNCFVK